MSDKLYFTKAELIAERRAKFPNEKESDLEFNAIAGDVQ